jgi:TPR repeat protein
VAATYLTRSADGGNSTAQLNVAHLLEEGIGMGSDHILAAKYYGLASQSSPIGCACYGWCCQRGRGVPVSFIEAAEYFQMAADGDSADGENALAICLELGLGIEKDMEQSVSYYRRAASQRHPGGMNNFGRCLEYGLGIEPDLRRAAKYYRLSAELQNADGINNFGICLERGVGIQANIDLAADHYKRAADGGHPEAAVNSRRCLRLLGRWTIPGRSSAVSEQKPTFEKLPSAAEDRFSASLQRFAETRRSVESIDGWHFGAELGRGPLATVTLAEDPKRAVKTLPNQTNARYFE